MSAGPRLTDYRLDDKWKDFEVMQVEVIEEKAHVSTFWRARIKQAFYAGAAAQLELIKRDPA